MLAHDELIDALGRPGERGVDKWDLEREFEENLKSEKYGKTMKLVDLYMKASSMKLANIKEDSVKNTIVLDNSTSGPPIILADWRLFNLIWPQPLVRPFWLLYLCYIAIKHLIMAVIRFKNDSTLKLLKYQQRRNQTSGKCLLIDGLSFEQKYLYHKLNETQVWLNQLGDPITSINGFAVVIYAFCFWAPTIIYLFSIYYMSTYGGSVIDVLAFLNDPKGVRRQLNKKLGVIVQDVIDAINFKYSERSQSCYDGGRLIYKMGEEFGSNCDRLIHQIIDVYGSDLIIPVNLTSKWHKHLIIMTVQQIKFFVLNFQPVGIVTFASILAGELYFRTKQRYETYVCQNWRSDAIYVDQTILLEEIPRQSDLDIYKQTNSSHLYSSAIFLESKYYISFKRLLTLLEIGILILVSIPVLWSPFRSWLLVMNVVDRSLWMDQITKQIDYCAIHMFTSTELVKLKRNYNSPYYNQSVKKLRINDYSEERLIKAMLTTYFNYMLFKSRYSKFRDTINYIMSQHCYFMLTMMGTLYLVALRTEIMYYAIVFYIALAFVVFINLYLLSGAIPLRKVHKIMKSIGKMFAYETEGLNPSLKVVIDLWRNQLLDEQAINQTYAFSLLGKHITFGWIVSFNANSVALLLLFLQ